MSGILLDFNSAPRQDCGPDHFDRDQISKERVERVRRELVCGAKQVLTHLFPQGVVSGSEFLIGDLDGRRGESLSICLRPEKIGVWKDFAQSQKGGDLIDLWMAARDVGFQEAINQIESFLGIGNHQFNPVKSGFKPLNEAASPTKQASKKDLGQPTAKWNYLDLNGNIIATVYRYDPKEGRKEFRPWDAIKKKHKHPEIRPLYNLPGVVTVDTVVLVEGEKCAEALIGLGVCATTAMGGAQAPTEKTDWSPLKEKQVLIWPDNDEPGTMYAENAKKAIEAAGGKAMILQVPEGRNPKWDAADAIQEGFNVKRFLTEVLPQKKKYRINLEDWQQEAYLGEAPVQEWLVDHVFPMSSASVLAAAGGSGKGMLGLHLALQVVSEHEPDLLNPYPKAFGNNVIQKGTVVIFSAEDDRAEIHRRLSRIDPEGRRNKSKYKLIVVPLPNSGGPAPIVVPGKNGPEATIFFQEIREQLLEIEDLKLVIFDPLSSFSTCDIAMSRVEGNFILAVLSSLATDTKAAVIAAHHLNKFKTEKPIATPEQARAMISGSAAVVDGSRVSYCLWPMEKEEAKRRCRRLNLTYERDKVFAGAVVKQNCPVDKEIKTFIRAENGLLYVMDEALRAAKIGKDELLEIIVDVIRRAALAGRPFTVWSRKDTCLSNRKDELPPELKDVGINRMAAMTEELIETDKVKKCSAPGSKTLIWLDVPGGPFYEGVGKFEPGFVEI